MSNRRKTFDSPYVLLPKTSLIKTIIAILVTISTFFVSHRRSCSHEKSYNTQVRGKDFVMENTWRHGAFFLVWSEQSTWRVIPIPNTVKGYVDLQNFVKAQARAARLEVTKTSRSCLPARQTR
jgi:hypothetical protein